MASEKQVNYLLILAAKAGLSTRWMDRTWKGYGAGMKDRSGKVEDYLRRLNTGEASSLIEKLKLATGGDEHGK